MKQRHSKTILNKETGHISVKFSSELSRKSLDLMDHFLSDLNIFLVFRYFLLPRYLLVVICLT